MRSLGVLAIVLASYGVVHADDHAKADALFEEAQKLKQDGKNAEACKKYDEALVYNRNAVGTLLNVALCNEEAGHVASALDYYTQARDVAREHKLEEHRVAAEERISKIEGLVPHLAISFAEIAANMKLVIDDKVYPIESAGDIRVDPGSRHIVVTAPGRVPFETTVDVKAQEKKPVAIPKLGLPVTVKSTRKSVGKILTFSGAGLVGTGVVLGLVARSKYNGQIGPETAMKNCVEGDPPKCNADGVRETDQARTFGNAGTVVGIVGVAALGLGAYLWFFAPSEPTEAPAVSIVPSVSPESAGLTAVGRF